MKLLGIAWGMGCTAAAALSSHVSGFIAVILGVTRQSISVHHTENLSVTSWFTPYTYKFHLAISSLYSCQSVSLSFNVLSHFINTYYKGTRLCSDPAYIFMHSGQPQCSTWGPVATVKGFGLSQYRGSGKLMLGYVFFLNLILEAHSFIVVCGKTDASLRFY